MLTQALVLSQIFAILVNLPFIQTGPTFKNYPLFLFA